MSYCIAIRQHTRACERSRSRSGKWSEAGPKIGWAGVKRNVRKYGGVWAERSGKPKELCEVTAPLRCIFSSPAPTPLPLIRFSGPLCSIFRFRSSSRSAHMFCNIPLPQLTLRRTGPSPPVNHDSCCLAELVVVDRLPSYVEPRTSVNGSCLKRIDQEDDISHLCVWSSSGTTLSWNGTSE